MRSSNSDNDTWSLDRGATVLPDGSVRFAVWAPNARRVAVRVLSGSAAGEHELTKVGESGVYEGVVRQVGADADYKYVLGGERETRELPDPVSRWQPQGVHGPSRVVDPGAFRWTDGQWRGIAMANYIIYELHVGTFTTAGTFDAVIADLPRLRELGVTAIEIMPVAEFPGGRNWGYDGAHLYAVENTYGGPDGLKQLVNAAHEAGLAVVLDVVYNHLGPEGNYLDAFGPYFTERYRTPWGRAVNYDGAGSDEVRRLVIDNALYWVTEYHVDGLRLDAVHGIFDFGALHVLQELADAVHRQAARLGRTVVVIGESDLNDPKLIRTPAEGGYGLDAQWSDDFHHAIHAALTGERSGYYADFGGVDMIAAALREPFVYALRYAPSRQRRHGAPSTGIPRERFVVAIQNHDQVGNRAAGDRLSTLVSPEQLKLAAALLFLSPYVPLLFMGEEYGETNPFLYFISHGDQELVESVRNGRREEFAAFGWGDAVPDPAAESTFANSKLDRTKLDDPRHAEIYALYRDLIALRKRSKVQPRSSQFQVPSSGSGGAESQVTCRDDVITIGRPTGDGRRMLAVFNCSDREQEVPLPSGPWRLVLSTHDAKYRGRVAAEVPAAVGAVGSSGTGRLRTSGDAWKSDPGTGNSELGTRTPDPGSRAAHRAPPWTAAIYTSETH
ncbi:MAG: malto-oligosyltrehalose trehalohydrolase [Gemmatimonadaceae bacterium]